MPRVIDFMAWQLAKNDRGQSLVRGHPVRSKCSYSAIVCEEMICLDNSNPLEQRQDDGVYMRVVRGKGYDKVSG